MVEAKDMTTIICEMDSMELCVWKEKHLQRACSGDEWIFREKEKEPEAKPWDGWQKDGKKNMD